MTAGVIPPPIPIRLIAGTGNPAFRDGQCLDASFKGPLGIAIGPSGHLVICDGDNRRIRLVNPLLSSAQTEGEPPSDVST